MAYYSRLLDISLIEDKGQRDALTSLLERLSSRLIGSIVETNAQLRLKSRIFTSDDLELAMSYKTSKLFNNAFLKHMESIDTLEKRYDISIARYRGAEQYLKRSISREGFDREFTILFDHLMQFFILHVVSTSLKLKHNSTFDSIALNLVEMKMDF